MKILCPNCGEIGKGDTTIYNTALRKQNIDISPIFPTCNKCGEQVSTDNICGGGEIIVINGTCGSGKSTIAGELMKRHGYFAIDGDCANQSLKAKISSDDPDLRKKVEFNSDETLKEISEEIDWLSIYGDKFVLAAVILPKDIARYEEIFRKRNLKYSFFLLRPSYEVAVQRCKTRTAHETITPESYVKYYYDKLNFDSGISVIDNSAQSAHETMQMILKRVGEMQ